MLEENRGRPNLSWAILDEINQIPGTFVLLFGDFSTDFVMGENLPNRDFGSCLYRWMECNGLFQVINEPTRITANSATLLDLIITNSSGFFHVLSILEL